MFNPKNVVRGFIVFILVYFAFLFQLVIVGRPSQPQRRKCDETCAPFGARGVVKNNRFFFTQSGDAECSCTIDSVQLIHRDGTVAR